VPPADLALLTIASLFVAAFTQGVTGFGFGLVAMALLPLFASARDASVLVGIFSLFSSVSVLASVRSSFRWRDMLYPLVGMFLGVPFGVYALAMLDEQAIRRLVALVVLVACVQVGVPGLRQGRRLHPIWGLPIGVVGGVLGGAFGIGGPPVIAYASTQDWDGGRYKAMLCSYFSASNAYRLVLLITAGLITRPLVTLGAVALPALFLGTYVGIRTFRRLSVDAFRKAVLVTLIVLARTLLFL
jgi:uncharacterized membrane protein YfcA